MIDWVSALIPLRHQPLSGGCVVKVSPDGEEEWTKNMAIEVEGSFASNLLVTSAGGDGEGRATHLYISGNPSKFLQGHNLFGSEALLELISDLFTGLCAHFKFAPTDFERHAVRSGEYELTRIDIARMFELPSRADVRSWLRAAEFKSVTRRGRPLLDRGTLYHGKHSRRWAFKFYCKADELNAPKHQLPEALKEHAHLEQWADNKLRGELVLRRMELKQLGLTRAKQLTPSVIDELYRSYVGRIEMTEQVALGSEQLFNLPKKLAAAYQLWNDGHDLRQMYSKPTFLKYRKQLKEHGINIDIRKECADRSNVVPLIRILEAKPAAIPDFAFRDGLVHRSARYAA